MKKNNTPDDAANEQPKTLTPTVSEGVSEQTIAEKMRAGLTREQALQVIQAQADNDSAGKSKK